MRAALFFVGSCLQLMLLAARPAASEPGSAAMAARPRIARGMKTTSLGLVLVLLLAGAGVAAADTHSSRTAADNLAWAPAGHAQILGTSLGNALFGLARGSLFGGAVGMASTLILAATAGLPQDLRNEILASQAASALVLAALTASGVGVPLAFLGGIAAGVAAPYILDWWRGRKQAARAGGGRLSLLDVQHGR